MTEDHFDTMAVKLPPEDMEKYEDISNTKSGTARMLIKSWINAVEEYDLKNNPEAMNRAILYAYKNSIEKHIESLKSQRDKLQETIDDIEDDDEDDEILFEESNHVDCERVEKRFSKIKNKIQIQEEA